MNNSSETAAYIVSVSFDANNKGVLVVGKQENGTMDIVNAFQNEEAYELYQKLITKR